MDVPSPVLVDPARENPRMRFITSLTLRTQQGFVLEGFTTDVSFGGAFLHTTSPAQGIKVGDDGVAAITVREGDREFQMIFPCQVARVTDRGIGLNFDDPEEES